MIDTLTEARPLVEPVVPATVEQAELPDPEEERTITRLDAGYQDTRSVDGGVAKRIEEIAFELADLERRLQSGDRNAAGDLAFLLEEQTLLQKRVSQATQEEPRDTRRSPLERLISGPLGKIVVAMTKPVNAPLETLRTTYMQSMLRERAAAGKSTNPFLTIPLMFKMMRANPSELADSITSPRTQPERHKI